MYQESIQLIFDLISINENCTGVEVTNGKRIRLNYLNKEREPKFKWFEFDQVGEMIDFIENL